MVTLDRLVAHFSPGYSGMELGIRIRIRITDQSLCGHFMEMNESKLIEKEITLRSLRFTKEVAETRRSLIRWLALSLGVINPGESRQGAISVFDAMLHFQFNEKRDPDVTELIDYIGSAWGPINEKTLRYHLLQLKNSRMISNKKGKYFMSQPIDGDRYDEASWLNYYFSTEIDPIKDRVIAAIKELRVKGKATPA